MNDRLMAAAIAVAVMLVVGGLILKQRIPQKPQTNIDLSQESAEDQRSTAVRATMTGCTRVGQRIRVDGIVHNLGTTTLSAVTVQTIWKDADGVVLDTGIVYAVTDSAPLSPGDERTFSDTTTLRNVARCNVRALDWFTSN